MPRMKSKLYPWSTDENGRLFCAEKGCKYATQDDGNMQEHAHRHTRDAERAALRAEAEPAEEVEDVEPTKETEEVEPVKE